MLQFQSGLHNAGTIFVCVKKSPIIPTYAALIVGYIIIRAAVKIRDVVMSSIKGKFDLIGYSKS